MAINCIHCGDEIDIGHYKDDDEREYPLDTSTKGEVHVVTAFRQRFRESGGLGRLHIKCFEEVFDVDVAIPDWAETDD